MSYATTSWAMNVDADITPVERFVLSALADFRNTETGLCCPSYSKVSAKTGYSLSSVKRAIKRLATLGLIVLKHRFNSSSIFTFCEHLFAVKSSEKPENTDVQIGGFTQTPPLEEGGSHRHQVVSERASNKELNLNPDSPPEREVDLLTPPSIDEVRAFCTDNHLTVDPDNFYHRNEGTAWMIGNTPILNWKSILMSWERKEPQFGRKVKYTGAKQPTDSTRDRSLQDDLADRSWAH